MTNSTNKRNHGFGMLGTVVLSSGLMVWMLWHFPVSTAIATVTVLSGLLLSAKLARWGGDTDSRHSLDPANHRA